MRPYVVTSRLLPTYDFVAAVPMSPAEARASVEGTLSRARNLLTTMFVVRSVTCLRARPMFWLPLPSIAIRFVPSVIGTNLHVRLSIGPFWWAILCGSGLSWLAASDGLAIAAALVALIVAVIVCSGIARAEQSVLESLAQAPKPAC